MWLPNSNATRFMERLTMFFEVMYGDMPLIVCCEMMDLAGRHRFRSIAPIYYRHTSVYFVVYDISNIDSFQNVAKETG